MTFEQAAILVLLCVMLAAFSVERLRIEVVAMAGLAVGFLCGLVPAERVFSGFASSTVVTVVEILIIVQVLGRARFLETVAGWIARPERSRLVIIAGLCGLSAFVSVFMNNIGAFVLMLPIVLHVGRSLDIGLRELLLPVSFATLLGGLCSAIGTPANLIVAEALQASEGRALALFDFAYAGVPVAIAGIVAIVLWVPGRFSGDGPADLPRASERRVVAERLLPPGSMLAGARLADAAQDNGLAIRGVVRDSKHVFGRPEQIMLATGDTLLVEAPSSVLDALAHHGDLVEPHASGPAAGDRAEAVIVPESTLVGSRIGSLQPFHERGVAISAVATKSTRVEGRFADIRLGIGDILYLRGERRAIAAALEECEALQLFPATRPETAPSWWPLAIFGCGVALAGTGVVAPDIAFGLVLLVFAALRFLTLQSALADINWPIIIMLAAMIPLGQAVETTGAAQVLSSALLSVLPATMPLVLVGAMLLLAVTITPFVNNASTAIILSPIAIELAQASSLPAEPFLIAVALGASLDFLTPFGHHNNTLAMGIGGYRFADYPRAGLPVTLAALAAALAALQLFWL